jgi:hypothetical protein
MLENGGTAKQHRKDRVNLCAIYAIGNKVGEDGIIYTPDGI